ncbi:dTDP-4-amino-4,6-dideoxygalactose transaminase [Streptosporangium subroseum]|uniref:dTDP-4-amino-4,6-dideoxygalactose transaminase n=1 Tax=Streptosporangium subroseum TaxID=106412 RepID=A0A239P1L2_9ACTN|nr:aminotransferase class I/II-fold pyridoxal phosphate-dependent enzyme [Streptosporangium subroseum]SNT60524.1 dTDP-4-amino-4,6-dideoxygalactose transaminase [Streptosporangium subroseum]
MQPDPIPWCAPDVSGNERRYLTEAAAAGQVGPAGTFLERFESDVAAAAGTRHAVATSSGTTALHIALLVAGVALGDEVLVPAWTFVATANAIRHAGAHPIVLDIEPDHWQLDVAQVRQFLNERCTLAGGRPVDVRTRRPVAAIVPVHLLGHPADLDPLRTVAADRGLVVVEDAAQGLAATYHGRPVGSGGLAITSFNANKLITTGGGGAIVTADPDQAARARYLINQAREHPVEYRHGEVGYNARMSNLHAAVGVAQMERLSAFVEAKRRIHDRYRQALGDLPGVTFQTQAPWARATRWFTTVLIDSDRFGMTARNLRERLGAAGIHAGPPWTPLHLTGAHRGCAPWPCPVAERLGRTALHLPCSTTLSTEQQDRVIDAIHQAA